MAERAAERRTLDPRSAADGANTSLGLPVEERVAWAERTHREAGERLLRDPDVRKLLKRFAVASDASHRRMLETGLAGICRACDLREGGSCCGKGIEDRYSGVLLLVNLLLGRALPRERFDPAGCYFLGRRGCVLAARHVICINYLCAKITGQIPPERLFELRDCEGEEIGVLFLLEERVKKVLGC